MGTDLAECSEMVVHFNRTLGLAAAGRSCFAARPCSKVSRSWEAGAGRRDTVLSYTCNLPADSTLAVVTDDKLAMGLQVCCHCALEIDVILRGLLDTMNPAQISSSSVARAGDWVAYSDGGSTVLADGLGVFALARLASWLLVLPLAKATASTAHYKWIVMIVRPLRAKIWPAKELESARLLLKVEPSGLNSPKASARTREQVKQAAVERSKARSESHSLAPLLPW